MDRIAALIKHVQLYIDSETIDRPSDAPLPIFGPLSLLLFQQTWKDFQAMNRDNPSQRSPSYSLLFSLFPYSMLHAG